jgi:hypothetical protein
MSAKYSGGPNASASFTITGATKVRAMVARVPAMKDPMAAVASACAPRPDRAMALPSTAVIMAPGSPGVFSRMEAVEPPYCEP